MTQQPLAVHHLFLLMGDNPLPNAVAALTLLRPGGTPHIVHTDRTQTQANNLLTLLTQVFSFQAVAPISLGSYQAEASVIRQRVQQRGRSLSGSIGMNYTGGTKPMSVHAYRALADIRPDAIFSYLDSNTSKITFDHDLEPSPQLSVDVQLTLEQLFQLHGLRWRPNASPLTRPIQAIAAQQLAWLYQDWPLVRSWRQWCEQQLRPLTKAGEFWKKEWELGQTPPISLQTMPIAFKEILQTHLAAGAESLALQTACKQGFVDITQVCSWLDGIWLEHYVLDQVQKIAQSHAIHDSKLSFHMVEPNVGKNQGDKFEFDVAFMRGYHLFAISCTTATGRALCKQKLLEASVRARQLGGSEARVALVCCNHRPDTLRSELEVASKNRKVAVFGRYDLPDLGRKIARWVEWNG